MDKSEFDKEQLKTLKDAYAAYGAMIGDAPLEIQNQYIEDTIKSSEEFSIMRKKLIDRALGRKE